MRPALLLCLSGAALAVAAPSAVAASPVSLEVSASADPRIVEMRAFPAFVPGPGVGLDLTVTGTADGIITVTSPDGIALSPSLAPCTVLTPESVRCGAPGDPVNRFEVYGGPGTDTVDLSGLAKQDSSPNAFPPFPILGAPGRMAGMFVQVESQAGDDLVVGGAAGAVYELGGGEDRVQGGPGDELVRADAENTDGDDEFVGGAGFDVLSYVRRTSRVEGTLTDGVSTGLGGLGENDSADGVEALGGGTAADELTLDGAIGERGTLLGGGGKDLLVGGPGPDHLVGGAGSTLYGGRGDDRLDSAGYPTPPTAPAIAPGGLHGGEGDDELRQGPGPNGQQYFNAAPTCGPGNDVLRADPGFDAGVDWYSGPADCELLATIAREDAPVIGEMRVGKTVTIGVPSNFVGASPAGRMRSATWSICIVTCTTRTTPGPEFSPLPSDAGGFLLGAIVELDEPLSQHPRWVEERVAPTEPSRSIRVSFAGGSATVLGPASQPTPAPTPTPTPKPASVGPDLVLLKTSFSSALGKKPGVTMLRRSTRIVVAAPAGTTLTVTLTRKVGKRVTRLSRGTATAATNGRATVTLKPTAAGRKQARRRASLKVTAVLDATAGGRTERGRVAVTLRGR